MLIIFLIPLNTDDVFSDNFYTLNNEVDTDTAAQEENDSQGEIIVVTMEKYWHILQLPELRKLPVSSVQEELRNKIYNKKIFLCTLF